MRSVLLIVPFLFLSACLGEKTENSNESNSEAETFQLSIVQKTFNDLPPCTPARASALAFVESESEFYRCSGIQRWEIFDKDILRGEKGLDGKDGIDGKDGLNGVNGRDGTNGKDGIDGKEGLNGLNGIDGQDGVDGANGKDGADGKDGSTSHVGHGPPDINIGNIGDIYFNTQNIEICGPKSASGWSCVPFGNVSGSSDSSSKTAFTLSVNKLNALSSDTQKDNFCAIEFGSDFVASKYNEIPFYYGYTQPLNVDYAIAKLKQELIWIKQKNYNCTWTDFVQPVDVDVRVFCINKNANYRVTSQLIQTDASYFEKQELCTNEFGTNYRPGIRLDMGKIQMDTTNMQLTVGDMKTQTFSKGWYEGGAGYDHCWGDHYKISSGGIGPMPLLCVHK